MSRILRPLGVAGLLVLAGACGAGDSPATDGEEVVLEPGIEAGFTVGRTEGGAWDSFSRVTSVAFDEEGRLYILDSDEHRVSVVDPDGAPVRQFGGQGDGPGQFRLPQALAVLPSGEVAVADTGHRGVLVFGPDGEYRRTVRFPEGARASANLLFPHRDDGVVFASRGITVTSEGGRPSMPTDIPILRMKVTEEEETSVIHRAWRPSRELPGSPELRGEGGSMRLPGLSIRAFEPQLHLAVLPDGRIAVADSSAYRIRILSPAGEVESIIERPVPPLEVTEEDRAAERERRLQELAEGGGPQLRIAIGDGSGGTQTMDQDDLRPMLEEQIRDMAFWPEIPVIRRMAADPEGRLWVRRSAGPEEDGPIEILRSDGSVVGTVPAAAMEVPSAFGPDGLAAWIERDELEIPRVRVGRVAGIP